MALEIDSKMMTQIFGLNVLGWKQYGIIIIL